MVLSVIDAVCGSSCVLVYVDMCWGEFGLV